MSTPSACRRRAPGARPVARRARRAAAIAGSTGFTGSSGLTGLTALTALAGLAALAGLVAGCDGQAAGAARASATGASATGASATDARVTDARAAEPPAAASATDGSAAAGFPRVVELPDGSRVVVPALPRRIVPAAAGSVDMICALVPPERIAGLPEQALMYSGLRDADSPYLARPRFDHYTAEPLLLLAPDLVVAYTLQSADTTRALAQAGIAVVTLPDPRGYDELCAQLALLGRLLGAEERAAALVADLEERLARLAAGAPARDALRVLSYSNYGGGGWAAADGTTADEIMRLAGVRNAATEAGYTGHARLGFEELLAIDPDLILVGRSGDGELGGTARMLRSEPVLRPLSALRDGLVELDAWLFTTVSQEMVTAAEELARQVDAHLARRAGQAAGPTR